MIYGPCLSVSPTDIYLAKCHRSLWIIESLSLPIFLYISTWIEIASLRFQHLRGRIDDKVAMATTYFDVLCATVCVWSHRCGSDQSQNVFNQRSALLTPSCLMNTSWMVSVCSLQEAVGMKLLLGPEAVVSCGWCLSVSLVFKYTDLITLGFWTLIEKPWAHPAPIRGLFDCSERFEDWSLRVFLTVDRGGC